MLMMSTAYRQSSLHNPEYDAVAEDTHYARWQVRRLEAEVIRDAIILLSGNLEPQMFGKAVPIRKDEVGQIVVGIDTTDSAGRPTGKVIPLDGQEFRRSIYVTVRRSQPLAVLNTFDAPIMEPNCNIRNTSTVTPQALLLLNSPFIHDLSEHFASRVSNQVNEANEQVKLAWQLAYSRPPSEEQLQEGLTFLTDLTQYFEQLNTQAAEADKDKDNKGQLPDPGQRALNSFCQALLSSNRFLYVD